MRRNLTRRWLAVIGVIVLVGSLAALLLIDRAPAQRVDLTEVITRINRGDVTTIELSSDGRTAIVTFEDSTETQLTLPPGQPLTTLLTDAGIPVERWPSIEFASESGIGGNLSLLIRIATFIGIGALLFFIIRKFGPGAFGSSNSRKGAFTPVKSSEQLVTFADVAGSEEVKQEVGDIVDFLRSPEEFRKLGARIPRGMLFVGPPGTGKTLIARALAGEARASYFSVSGSEFVELYVGVGASRVRELFKRAKEAAPSIIFIDEIDAIGRRRGRMEQSSEYDQTLNQILVEMDGFEERSTVVVVAATNRVDILDSALLRPGRFDRKVMVDLPDRTSRLAILDVHARGKPFAKDVKLDEIAARTTGMSGADLANVINEAAILAARARLSEIGMKELYEALDRTIAGPARNARRFSETERKVIAYHEAGHAVVAHALPHADTVRKVSIVSRGQAGGFTMIVPDEDRGLWTRSQLNDRLAALLGGMAAEEMIFGDITTGSSNDLEQTTGIASSMVQRYGMSQRFGLLSVGSGGGDGQFSPQRAFTAEQETLDIVGAARLTANAVLTTHRDDLERVANRLLEVETIEGDELVELIDAPRAVWIAPKIPRTEMPQPHERRDTRSNRTRGLRKIGRAAFSGVAVLRSAVSFGVRSGNPQKDRT